jgi:2-dehydropantoate 2-reductase
MRILILGAGAVGAYVGGHLALKGRDVTLVDPWPGHVDAMNANGLRLEGMSAAECFTVAVRARHLTEVQGFSREGPFDVAFVCMKSYDTAWATHLLKDYLAPAGFVVSLQNCINEETIAGVVGWGKTVGCIASKISVELMGPARVKRGVPKGPPGSEAVFRVGEVHGRETPRVREIASMLEVVDGARVTTNLWGERWSKLVANAMRNGICAASGMTANACDREPVTRGLAIRVAGEAVRAGLAQGFVLETINGHDAGDWVAALEGDDALCARIEQEMEASTAKRSEAFIPSMAQDVNKGRRTEIEFINGLVVTKAREIGLEASANAGLTRAVRRVERGEHAPALALLQGI